MKNWSVYLLRCSDDSLYTGATCNLPRRIKLHNDGKASKYTRARRPIHLVASRNSMTRSEALTMEAKIKRLKKADKERIIKTIHELRGSDDPAILHWSLGA